MNEMDHEAMLRPQELQRVLGISRTQYFYLLREGLPSMIIGGGQRPHRRFWLPDVREWLAKRRPKQKAMRYLED